MHFPPIHQLVYAKGLIPPSASDEGDRGGDGEKKGHEEGGDGGGMKMAGEDGYEESPDWDAK